jgi:glycosyltransferase involved in cell wall biosynthesis
MNIFMSADWFYPAQMGGPSNAIYWQAKAMTRAGHQVTVVATSQNLPDSVTLNRWLPMDCGGVIYTKNPHFYLPIKHIWYGISAIRRADVVHINSLFYPSSWVLVLAAKLLQKPIIWTPHGELSPAALAYRPRLKRFLLSLFRRLSHQVVFHATSSEETDHIRKHVGSRAIVREIANRMEMPPMAIRNARPYILFVGRLHPIKAIDYLLEALSASTVFRRSDYTLVIAGPDSGGYQAHLVQLIQQLDLLQKVVIRGLVRSPEKEQLYADAHVLVLPSHSENFGNVVIEALAQGTPVITSTGTPWQLLETEQAGSWVSNQPDCLRAAIERFLQMPAETYQLYRNRALKLARDRYDIFKNTDQWEQFYQETL